LANGCDPDVLVALTNPEGCAAAEHRRIPGNLPLQPVGVIFRHTVLCGCSVSRDAFGAGNVHESVVASSVSFLGHRVNGLQLLGGIYKAFVPARDVIVYLDPEDVVVCRALDNLIRVVEAQAMAGDTHIVRPILIGLAEKSVDQTKKYGESSQHGVLCFSVRLRQRGRSLLRRWVPSSMIAPRLNGPNL
jgi:hypothetical protein